MTRNGKARGAVLVIYCRWGLASSFRDCGEPLARAGYLVGLSGLFGGQTARTERQAHALCAARLCRVLDGRTQRADQRRTLDRMGRRIGRTPAAGAEATGTKTRDIHRVGWPTLQRNTDVDHVDPPR